MIIPYGHEHTTVRRLPWVTFTIMGLCVLVFIGTQFASSSHGDDEAIEGLGRIFEYLVEHPYLELDPRFFDLLRQRNVSEQEIEEFQSILAAMRHMGGDPPDSRRRLADEQEELERLIDEFMGTLAEMRDHPFYRWGLVPAHVKLHTLVTYQFLHGGFWHLFGNLFFLFLAGPFIEDVWGRPLFAGFYLLAGAVAGLMYAVHYPTIDGPLIGASGSVAGVMGAFLIRYWKTKIRFFYWFFVVFRGTFTAPAWLMLPLWFLRELFFAQAWDVVAPGAGGGGVAHWAHVWGFAFGLVIAGAMRHYRVEERWVHEAIESKITLVDNTAVEQAIEAGKQGRSGEAFELLHAELKSHPNNVDAAVALWNLAMVHDRAPEAAPYLVRLMRQAVRDEDPSLVLNHWHELLAAVPDLRVDPPLAARAAEILFDHGRQEEVVETVGRAAQSLQPDTPSTVIARLARVATATHAPSAGMLVEAALAHPEVTSAVRSELESLTDAVAAPALELAGIQAAPEAVDEQPGAAVIEVEHSLQIMPAVPLRLDDGSLTVDVQGETRRMALGQIQAIGVGGIRPAEQRPFLLVDLMLDPPWSERSRLRVVRLSSTDFDPRRLVAGVDDSLQAFRDFLDGLLTSTGAAPLPDPDAARGQPFRTFDSIASYEREVLGVVRAAPQHVG
jgi:membrane associated rhomboid family serine protease